MSTPAAPRALTLPAATALVVGQVIAVGIFLTPGTIIRTLASPLWVLGLWAVMGGMAVCGALAYGALAARFPQAGGGYVYLREAYGPRVAFAYGWKCLLVMDPGITAALAAGFATYVAYLVPLTPFAVRLVAVAPIAAFALLHITGVRLGAGVLSTVAALKIVLVVGLTVAAFLSPAASLSHFTPFAARAAGSPPLAGALAGAFVAAFFSFGGWWEVTKIAGEVARPSWTLPRALVVGLVTVTLCYASATMAFLAVVPPGQIAAGDAVVAQVGDAIFGSGGGTVVALIVIVCVLGSLGGMQMVAPRLYVAMAEDGLFPSGAAASHPRFGTPARAIAIQAGLASLLVLLGSFDSIVAYFVFATVGFIAATVAGVFILQRRNPTLVVPGHPWTTMSFIALVFVLMGLLAVSQPVQATLGAAVVAAAWPVHAVMERRRR
ncbi:MAG TPA: amino acid permease [Luteitalea sp.]|nr:amino acid permease [Luteitalea sp.]